VESYSVRRACQGPPWTVGHRRRILLGGPDCWSCRGLRIRRTCSAALGPVKRFLELRALRFIGLFAYSLYLVHAPLLEFLRAHILEPANLDGWPAFLVMLTLGLPVAIAGAYGFFLLFERPFLTIRSWADFQAGVRAAIRVLRRKVGSSGLNVGKGTTEETSLYRVAPREPPK
jgi:hypothetical protein